MSTAQIMPATNWTLFFLSFIGWVRPSKVGSDWLFQVQQPENEIRHWPDLRLPPKILFKQTRFRFHIFLAVDSQFRHMVKIKSIYSRHSFPWPHPCVEGLPSFTLWSSNYFGHSWISAAFSQLRFMANMHHRCQQASLSGVNRRTSVLGFMPTI